MAEKKAAPSIKPLPTNAKPASSASVKADPAVPAKKNGFDPLRPVRYAMSFAVGTMNHTLDGMANGGRRGAWVGTGAALLMMLAGVSFATGGLAFVAAGWMAGLAGGAVLGGAVGALTGGVKGMDRENRKDKYAADLLKKARAKSRPNQVVDYRDAHREYKHRSDYVFDRLLQQERENAQDTSTYYRDMVQHSRHGGHNRGF